MTTYKDAMKASPQGVFLFVHVIPGSSQSVFPGAYNPWRNSIEIKVRSQAKENKANTEILETIAQFFQLTTKDVILVSGEKQREKTIRLKNISANAVGGKLKEFYDG
jgi:uncharacterized protein